MSVDSRAIVDARAKLAKGVTVGPYSVIGPEVEIGTGTWVGSHVVIQGPTRIGADNRIFQFASIGEVPQDKKFAGEQTGLEIGDRNTIREYVTIHRGTVQGGGITRLGDDNLIMAYSHIAHDCHIANHTIFANGASLGGHVRVDDYAILGGFTLVHQFCAIGAHAFCAMSSAIAKDVPPYVMVAGHPARPRGLNTEGLRRRGFDAKTLLALRRAYKVLYRSGLTLEEALQRLRTAATQEPALVPLVAFLEGSRRSITR